MPIPTVITDLSATAGLNSPSGSDPPTQGDDYLRALSAILRTEYDDRTGFAANLALDTTSTVGAELVGYDPVRAYTTGVGEYLNYTFGRSASEVSAGVTPTAYQYPVGDARRYGADPAGSSDSTTAIGNALAAAVDTAYLVAGTYKVSALAGVASKKLKGPGAALVTLKIPAGGTANIITASAVADFALEGVTLDYTGGGAGTGVGLYASSCARLRLNDIKVKATKGIGIQILNCADFRFNGLWVDSAEDWGMSVDGASSTDGYASALKFTNCTNRGLFIRDASRCTFDGIEGKSNGASVVWMSSCIDCRAYNVSDYLDAAGDTAVIDGSSFRCMIDGVVSTTCGGHTASISATGGGAPVECHIINVQSVSAGECMAAITDQGTGNQPVNCSIRNVSGRNCGRVSVAEGFAISNAVGCFIEGSITDSTFSMNYAAREGGASPSFNRFHVSRWVTGTSGYASMSSSTSVLEIPLLDKTRTAMGDADLTLNAGTSPRSVFADTALTAARTLNLPASWIGDNFWVYRTAGGAFNLLIKDGVTTVATLTGADTWARVWYDGTSWVKQGS